MERISRCHENVGGQASFHAGRRTRSALSAPGWAGLLIRRHPHRRTQPLKNPSVEGLMNEQSNLELRSAFARGDLSPLPGCQSRPKRPQGPAMAAPRPTIVPNTARISSNAASIRGTCHRSNSRMAGCNRSSPNLTLSPCRQQTTATRARPRPHPGGSSGPRL